MDVNDIRNAIREDNSGNALNSFNSLQYNIKFTLEMKNERTSFNPMVLGTIILTRVIKETKYVLEFSRIYRQKYNKRTLQRQALIKLVSDQQPKRRAALKLHQISLSLN